MVNLTTRIKIWDELRGVAIIFMIVTHFMYYNAERLYQYGIADAFGHLTGIVDLVQGVINLNASYMAPFLFLFIVGIVSHNCYSGIYCRDNF